MGKKKTIIHRAESGWVATSDDDFVNPFSLPAAAWWVCSYQLSVVYIYLFNSDEWRFSYSVNHEWMTELLGTSRRSLEEEVVVYFYQSFLHTGSLFPKDSKMKLKEWVSA